MEGPDAVKAAGRRICEGGLSFYAAGMGWLGRFGTTRFRPPARLDAGAPKSRSEHCNKCMARPSVGVRIGPLLFFGWPV